jgi:hypothetical protein
MNVELAPIHNFLARSNKMITVGLGWRRGRAKSHAVFVIDDDASVRQAITSLLQSVAFECRGVWFACRFL